MIPLALWYCIVLRFGGVYLYRCVFSSLHLCTRNVFCFCPLMNSNLIAPSNPQSLCPMVLQWCYSASSLPQVAQGARGAKSPA
ncbi:hypothetical protein BZA77DRAFT_315868 [Pyronema omphalodes]|nr:hypothetical protein BZA77DRAFT_315868 [Pyronema omphalodes]